MSNPQKTSSLCIPGTQMTLVLLEKGLVLEGSAPKIQDKQVPGVYYFICHSRGMNHSDSIFFTELSCLLAFLHLGSGDLCEHHRLCHGSTISR